MERVSLGPALVLIVLFTLSAPVMAQQAEVRVLDGRQIAERWCSGCHAVSPEQRHIPADAIPSFASIARMPSTTKTSLQAFLMSPHPPMPDLRLSRQEMNDLSEYILSLRGSHQPPG